MDDLSRKYLQLIKQMINLQKELVTAFEETVKIKPITLCTDDEIREFCAGGNPERVESLKKLRDSWPSDWPVGRAAMITPWGQPREGVMKVENLYWHYFIHGMNEEVRFSKLPLGVEEKLSQAIQADDTIAKRDIFLQIDKDKTEVLPSLDITYLEEGRKDGFRAWAVYIYAKSIVSDFGKLDYREHENLLQKLVDEEVLQPISGGDGQHYVLV